jgi:hypothetical protein
MWTAENSGHEDRRYLGMSRISECPRRLYFEVLNGTPATESDKLRFYAGYLWERDVVSRLKSLGLYSANSREITALGGRFVGHTDGEIEGDLLEIKSVTSNKYERLLRDKRLPSNHFRQIQTYMLHGKYQRAFVVYVVRDMGDIHVEEVRCIPKIGETMTEKARRILSAIDAGNPPQCECGNCAGA